MNGMSRPLSQRMRAKRPKGLRGGGRYPDRFTKVMAPLSQTGTQTPQPRQTSAFTSAERVAPDPAP